MDLGCSFCDPVSISVYFGESPSLFGIFDVTDTGFDLQEDRRSWIEQRDAKGSVGHTQFYFDILNHFSNVLISKDHISTVAFDES